MKIITVYGAVARFVTAVVAEHVGNIFVPQTTNSNKMKFEEKFWRLLGRRPNFDLKWVKTG